MSLAAVIGALRAAGIAPTGRELAEAVWLARYAPVPEFDPGLPESAPGESQESDDAERDGEAHPPTQPELALGVPRPSGVGSRMSGHAVGLPEAPGLTRVRDLQRALRPLRRRAPSRLHQVLDEEATTQFIASTGIWSPVRRPAQERWFDVVLAIDASSSMRLWRVHIAELHALLSRTGAFRDVRAWHLRSGDDGCVVAVSPSSTPRSHRELVDSAGRRIFIVVTDGAAGTWHEGTLAEVLGDWARTGPVAVLQVLPEELWARTGLPARAAVVHSSTPGAPNTQLRATFRRQPRHRATGPVVPVLSVEPTALAAWARLVLGVASGAALAVTAGPPKPAPAGQVVQGVGGGGDELHRFRAGASPEAYQLAVCLSAVPLTLPIMRLVQHVAVPAARTSALAEIMLGGLLARTGEEDYEFLPGVREGLLKQLRRSEASTVLTAVARYISNNAGRAGQTFPGLVGAPDGPVEAVTDVLTAVHPVAAARLGLPVGTSAAPGERVSAVTSASTGRRKALLIANRRFKEPAFRDLDTERAGRLAEVLAEPSVGAFDVTTLRNESSTRLGTRVRKFFASGSPHDTLLLYVMSNGTTDRRGNLYIDAFDNRADRLASTILDASAIVRLADESPARQVVIIFDCGHIGRSWWDNRGTIWPKIRAVGADSDNMTRVTIISCEDESAENIDRSSFTTAVIDALTSPLVDTNGDGVITAEEFCRYIEGSRRHHRQQLRWQVNGTGRVVLAQVPAATVSAEKATVTVRDRSGDRPTPPDRDIDLLAPVFYLCYARRKARRSLSAPSAVNSHVLRIYDDLSLHINELVELPPGVAPGFMDQSLEVEGDLTPEILDPLGRCQVFLPLMSTAMFNSRWCGMEWNAFSHRRRIRRTDGREAPGTGIIPVLWSLNKYDRVPTAVRVIQHFMPQNLPHSDIAPMYEDNGLYGLLVMRREREYQAVVWKLAQRVAEIYHQTLTEPLRMEAHDLPDAFVDDDE